MYKPPENRKYWEEDPCEIITKPNLLNFCFFFVFFSLVNPCSCSMWSRRIGIMRQKSSYTPIYVWFINCYKKRRSWENLSVSLNAIFSLKTLIVKVHIFRFLATYIRVYHVSGATRDAVWHWSSATISISCTMGLVISSKIYAKKAPTKTNFWDMLHAYKQWNRNMRSVQSHTKKPCRSLVRRSQMRAKKMI